MFNKDLIRYIAESAGELIGKAEKASPVLACEFQNEAEELLMLGALILKRRDEDEISLKEAA